MPRFRMRQRHFFGIYTPPIDTRWGTATDSAGRTTLGGKPGLRRVWVNGQRADNTGDGLSPGAAKKGWKEAVQVFQTGKSDGDHLMVAGLAGMPDYIDDANATGLGFMNVASTTATKQYPYAVQSYDPADPFNEAKYGELYGPAMPVLALTANTPSLSLTAGNGNGGLAFKGLEIKGRNTLHAYQSDGLQFGGGAGPHPNLFFQNMRFNRAGISFGWPVDMHMSRIAIWNSSGIYADGDFSGLWFSDMAGIHNGWDIGASRLDAVGSGGPQPFTHNWYLHSGGRLLGMHRILAFDGSNEGIGPRCGFTNPKGASQWVSFGAAAHFQAGGFSAGGFDDPGILFQLDDCLAIGGSILDSTHPFFATLSCDNVMAGSYIRNCGVFDNPERLSGSGADMISYNRAQAAEDIEHMLLQDWSCWNAHSRLGYVNQAGTNLNLDMLNCVLDVDPVSYMGNGYSHTETNVTKRTVAPAGYLAEAAFIASLSPGLTRNQLVNLVAHRPDLPWTPAICNAGLLMMGKTPQFPTVSFPDISGITPPAVY